jgi:dihydroxyacetone kinase-like protein
MEVGVGIHGEPGRRRVKLRPAAEIAAEMVNAITTDLGERARGEAILLINGFGATPLSELYLMYDAVRRGLEPGGTGVARSLVGNFVTSLDMAGCSATVSMLDDEMKRLWDAPVHTPALRWGM